ncbi:hypothetical protein [Novosphingobium sp. NRRL B-2648]|jgi:hypothetical protein|uniref:hypothetical protein n=1 Tax=Novosphingobium TaxID=165696 RepID=UPI003514BF25
MKAGFDVGLAAEVAQGEWAIWEGMATALPLSLALWAVILWAVILWAVILWLVR